MGSNIGDKEGSDKIYIIVKFFNVFVKFVKNFSGGFLTKSVATPTPIFILTKIAQERSKHGDYTGEW